MKRKYSRKPSEFRGIALERINALFANAESSFREDSKLSDRYVGMARKIAMKYKVRIPRQLKRRFCKHCNSYLVPGRNARVRLSKGKITMLCYNCKNFMRIPYS